MTALSINSALYKMHSYEYLRAATQSDKIREQPCLQPHDRLTGRKEAPRP